MEDFSKLIIYFWRPAFFAFVLAFLLVTLALDFFPKWGLMDRPKKYGLKRKPIPYYGGITIFFSFLISVIIFVPLSMNVFGLLIGAALIALIGFLDDYFDVKPIYRLFVQFFASLILVFFGIGVLSFNLPFLGEFNLVMFEFGGVYLLSAVFTIFWVMAIVNALNFQDGISGLNSGVVFIASMTIFFLSIHPDIHDYPGEQIPVAMLALILAMSSLAFWVFDFPKPRILMGDTGSTFLGFVLAVLAIFSGGKIATAFLVLGLPILDMIWVVVRRTIEGKKFWKGDLKHLHHRLLRFGISERKVLGLYYLITFFFGVSAIIFVSTEQKIFMVISLIVFMTLLAASLVLVRKE